MMERLQRAAIIFSLIDELSAAESWCGETHIQKSTYFLQELFAVPLEYNFILYKFGPYSFDFHGDLQGWRGDNLLDVEIRNQYGPSILPGKPGEKIKSLYTKTLSMYSPQIEAVAHKLGPLGVSELERLATALYVTREGVAEADVEARAKRLMELKPHVSKDAAMGAVKEVDAFVREMQSLLPTQ